MNEKSICIYLSRRFTDLFRFSVNKWLKSVSIWCHFYYFTHDTHAIPRIEYPWSRDEERRSLEAKKKPLVSSRRKESDFFLSPPKKSFVWFDEGRGWKIVCRLEICAHVIERHRCLLRCTKKYGFCETEIFLYLSSWTIHSKLNISCFWISVQTLAKNKWNKYNVNGM